MAYSLKVLSGKFDGDDRAQFFTVAARAWKMDVKEFKGSLLFGQVQTDQELTK